MSPPCFLSVYELCWSLQFLLSFFCAGIAKRTRKREAFLLLMLSVNMQLPVVSAFGAAEQPEPTAASAARAAGEKAEGGSFPVSSPAGGRKGSIEPQDSVNSHGVVDLPTTDRRCAKAHLVAEISDSDFTGERLALLCETYMNEIENVFVVTDSFDAIVLGSPAQAACSPHIRILSTGMPHLNRNVATAQLRRAWVIDAYLEEVGHLGSRHNATDEDSWVVLTDFDTWWEPRLLEEYINFLEEHRRDGDITIGGAGSGRLSSMSEERRDWGSTNLRGENLDETTMTGKLAIPYGGMSILPLSDMRFAFGEAAGGAVACQSNVLDTCFAEEESSTGFPLSECGRMGRLGWLRSHLRHGAASQRGAPFNNDHVFMACVADKAARSSRKISALWPGPAIKFTSP